MSETFNSKELLELWYKECLEFYKLCSQKERHYDIVGKALTISSIICTSAVSINTLFSDYPTDPRTVNLIFGVIGSCSVIIQGVQRYLKTDKIEDDYKYLAFKYNSLANDIMYNLHENDNLKEYTEKVKIKLDKLQKQLPSSYFI